MSGPSVSVIVPVLDAEPYIERCIRGLLAQTFRADGFEILMVDNGSMDRSLDIARRFSRVRLLREPKRGAYAARNRGLAEARGDLIAFTDPDCVPDPNWLAALTAPFRDRSVQVAKGRTRPGSSSPWLRLLIEYEHHRDLYVFGADDPTLYYGQTNNLATRRATLEREGGFTELARGADVIYVRRVVDRFGCDAVRYRPRAKVLHLEVDGLLAHFAKVAVYRLSRTHFGPVAGVRKPTMRERLRILSNSVRAGDVTVAGALPGALLLAAAVTYGRIAGAGRLDSRGRIVRGWGGHAARRLPVAHPDVSPARPAATAPAGFESRYPEPASARAPWRNPAMPPNPVRTAGART